MALKLRRDPEATFERYNVYSSEWVCGLIQYEGHRLGQDYPPWRWIIQLGGATPEGVIRDDRAESLEAAKAAFAEKLAEVDCGHGAGRARRERGFARQPGADPGGG
jgi:hypothetical protein